MSNEWRTIAITDGELNGDVDEVREVGDTILKGIVRNLHDSRRVLQDGDLWTLVHFQRTQHQAIFWLRLLD